MDHDDPVHQQLRWTVSAEARPSRPGAAVVGVVARNAMGPELSFEMVVDGHAGAEAADVEGRALVILSMLARELAAECERIAGARFDEG